VSNGTERVRLPRPKPPPRALRPWYKKKRYWLLAVVVIVAVVSVVEGNRADTNLVGTPTSKISLPTYFRLVNKHLSQCVAGIRATQTELAIALKPNAPAASRVPVYNAATRAIAPCTVIYSANSPTSIDENLFKLNSVIPPSGYPSLNNFSYDAQLWADTYSLKTLRDVAAIASDPSSSADVKKLLTDSLSANTLGLQLIAEANSAAKKGGMKSTENEVILMWHLAAK